MIYKTCYWDNETKQQLERDCTPAEVAEIELRKLPKPAAIPQSVTMRQARLALMGAGKLATVNAAIEGMPGVQGDAARIEWEFSSEVKRGQPLVMSMGQVLGLNAEQLDALFTTASGL